MEKANKRISMLVNTCFGMMSITYVVVAILGLVKWYAGVSVALIGTINTIANIVVLRRNPASVKYRYLVTLGCAISFASMLFQTPYDVTFGIGMIQAFLFIGFYDMKMLTVFLAQMNAVNIIHVVKSCITHKMASGRELDGVTLFLQVAFLLLASFIILAIAGITIQTNKEQMAEIEAIGSKNKEILDNMKSIAKEVKDNTDKGSNYIEDLNKSTQDSLNIFKEIALGNTSNAESVEKQADMTNKITGLIEKVSFDTNKAIDITKNSMDELNVGKEVVVELKNQSTELVNYNKKVMLAMKEFVDNARNVREITSGIADISEQTNLLSLNASIESARAGEAGVGFAIVAQEIRKLADETASLTTDIAQIVALLENDANDAQNIIGEVEQSVVEETNTIDETLTVFKTMENDISSLGKDMDNILDSSENIVNYNNSIMEHIEQLSGETQEVTAYIEEALALNRLNREKTETTKTVMEQLSLAVEELL